MNESRKRRRPDEDDYAIQSKYFVTSQLVEKCDKDLMNGIYAKTLNILKAGAKLQYQNQNQQIQVNHVNSNNSSSPTVLDTMDDKLQENQNEHIGCMLCWRDFDPQSNSVCKNCNLTICNQCQSSCCGCSGTLCGNCIKIFGCSIGDNPICEGCKYFVE